MTSSDLDDFNLELGTSSELFQIYSPYTKALRRRCYRSINWFAPANIDNMFYRHPPSKPRAWDDFNCLLPRRK